MAYLKPTKTWGEVKDEVYQALEATDGTTIDSDLEDYYDPMLYTLANNVLVQLCTAGKYKQTIYEFSQSPQPENLITSDNMYDVYQFTGTDATYEGEGALAYSFSIDNAATVYIEFETSTDVWTAATGLDDLGNPRTLTFTKTASAIGAFVNYRGRISNPSAYNCRIRFSGTTPYSYRNVALYGYTYTSNTLVPEYTPYIRYDLEDLIEDFFQLIPTQLVMQADYSGGWRYLKTGEYSLEGDHTLVLPAESVGEFRLTYAAYPCKIDSSTEDDYLIDTAPEVANLLAKGILVEIGKIDYPERVAQWEYEYTKAFNMLAAPRRETRVSFNNAAGLLNTWG